ncbi:daunorubicin resistance protein DrrA family ABC transporter ATP-binding protein [Nocardia seriolae]|uniref:daunorubicin resistance protein DrrA family ABC transporter ATP-binding protein n=1 Tax=Nocardia seriolae TaxID=37332 RepID=UPI00051A0406|nr:daunorubicin resistance protein DrrA family ABC transporter ATP-binding protein [Nocardia seriolae]RLP30494.1 daunorubicin resistance protein DrrA family ABC transporter ATP-binding protein [Nocardia seriolae]WKY50083.1 daunorubicin resistance protein DrrA family ABC transporter ATP-binding protein [Nocardia seriolae]BAW06113.1 ABC transporter [Nocardia seriolae]BEK87439.1 daunorubicin resistance protein DrrA family ABC transporter ATP-binding protein [Nocardia seriolae]GEM25242.1 daunorubi
MATSGPALAIEVGGLSKSFGDQPVLRGIDVSVPAGTVFALLGPNGAGKTTVVRILTTLNRPDGGEVRVGGHDPVREPDAVRALIGVTGQFAAVDEILTGAENLRLMGRLLHLGSRETGRRTARLLEQFELTDAADKRAGSYSGGMRRRLDIAMSLMGRPRIVFLDEPTTGLDPRSRRELWRVIRELVATGVTIFLTTQYLEEADQLADRIAVLDGGRIVAEGSAAELKRLVPGGHIRLGFADEDGLVAAARAIPAAELDVEALALQVPSDGSVGEIRKLLDHFDDHAVSIGQLSIHTTDLDDVFFALTGATTKEAVR